MKDNLKFSELGVAYSTNLFNLSEARKVFEEECRQLNSNVDELVKEHKRSYNSDKSKFLTKIFTWGNPAPWSTTKDGSWLNFVQGTYIDLNLKTPGRQKFENSIAYIQFEITFDDELRRFIFKVRFENKYEKNDLLDEKVFELAAKCPEDFPKAKHIKSSTSILGYWELDQHLAQNINSIVTKSMMLIENAFSELYPEEKYKQKVTASIGETIEDEVA